ncbi:MAG TPA: hypothetical protein VFE46_06845 [Pirellulales bacterium]|jgi:hypothetical protein|nr:hypothetical protein [Pirellulales bacterium]
MARSKGIHQHPFFKLGKAPVRRDPRTMKFASLVKARITIPKEYDFDAQHRGIPTPMFANDRYGDCVMAGRAHQTLRFELVEQKKIISISDQDVIREYFEETGGADTGLVVLDSLQKWQSAGWLVGAANYKIRGYSELELANHDQVKQAIVLDLGVGLGLSLPLSAQVQFQTGKPWDVVRGPRGAVNSWGGHYVFVPGYTTQGPVCVTWGRKQQMTWAFFDKFCDEAYAIIDAVDTQKIKQNIDVNKLEELIAVLAAR